MSKLHSIDMGDSFDQLYLNPTGGGGGGGGGGSGNMRVTQTTTNPVVPDEMQPMANALNSIATALLGAPVNFGAIPGLDAPSRPTGSWGDLLAKPAFQMGANRMNATGQGRIPNRGMGRSSSSMGNMFAMPRRRLYNNPSMMPRMQPPITNPRSTGVSMPAPPIIQPDVSNLPPGTLAY